jgi:hypothetical protein
MAVRLAHRADEPGAAERDRIGLLHLVPDREGLNSFRLQGRDQQVDALRDAAASARTRAGQDGGRPVPHRRQVGGNRSRSVRLLPVMLRHGGVGIIGDGDDDGRRQSFVPRQREAGGRLPCRAREMEHGVR